MTYKIRNGNPRPKSGIVERPGAMTIGNVIAESGEVDGPMAIDFAFIAAATVLLRKIGNDDNIEASSRAMLALAQARSVWNATKVTP